MIKKIINLSIYLLRYFSVIHTKYKISTEIDFGSALSNDFFKKQLEKCKFYLEYGAGNSTLLANKLEKNYISIEADKSFFNYLRNDRGISKLKYINLGPTKYFSYPIFPYILIKKKINFYCNYINTFFIETKKIPDFILIDGRFRSKTCLCIISFLLKERVKDEIVIIIDDYEQRENYKMIEKIVDVNKIGRFGVIKSDNFANLSKEKLEDLISKSAKDEL